MNTPMDLLAEDSRNRARALEVASFIVEAPAGAGKTELLTQRYLRLLVTVAEPEEILAITFTNKAAAEMRGRILASLQRAASGVLPDEPHKRITFELARAALAHGAECGWQLTEQPARLRILTIDALCASLARQMPLLSRFGAQPSVCNKAARHYDEAAKRTLAMLDEDGSVSGSGSGSDSGLHTAGAAIAEALRHFDNDGARLTRLLSSMLARRDQWLRHCLAAGDGAAEAAQAEAGLAALVQRDLMHAAAGFDGRLQAQVMSAVRYAAAQLAVSDADSPLAPLLDWTSPLVGELEELDAWRALVGFLLTQKDTPRKTFNVKNGLPPGKGSEPHKKVLVETLAGLDAASVAALARIRCLPEPVYGDDEWATVEIMATLLKLAAAQLWTVFNEVGEADFIEVAQRALLALGDEDAPSDLALSLDYRVRHLLVDEFQDTSPLQVGLLERLTAGWQADDGRTLFCVGDPMQSIYRFRKADVGLFLGAAQGGIGGVMLEPLRLYRNNRSSAAVIDWINGAFAHILPPCDEAVSGAIAYRAFSASRADLDADASAGVYVHALIGEKGKEDETGEGDDMREAACMLDLINRERAVAPARRIAVLVRARTHLAALVALIRRTQPDLAFQAVEVEPLGGRQAVQDLLALTHALLHRADRVHWLAVLRAPWCGLRLVDLHALVVGLSDATNATSAMNATIWQMMNDATRIARLSTDGQMRLAHVHEVFAEAFAHQGRVGLCRWVEGVWLKLGGAACLHGPGGASPAASVEDVRAFFDLLARLDAAGEFDVDALADEVAELYAAPDASDDRLQLMTIHKSKGLEFDTVILPGLHRKPRGEDHQLMLWEEVALDGVQERLVVAPYVRRPAGAAPTPYDYLRLLEQERSANETMRVLYVAATRAIRRLHLVGVAPLNKEGEPRAPANTFLELLWPLAGVANDFAMAAEMSGAEDEDAAEFEVEVEAEFMDEGEDAASAESAESVEETGPFIPQLVRLVVPRIPEVLLKSPRHVRVVQEEIEDIAQAVSGVEQGAPDERLAADIGTLTHACLQQIATDGLASWNAQRMTAQLPALRLWLLRRGHAAEVAQTAAARVVMLLDTTLSSERGRWLLAAHEEAAAELALTDIDEAHGAFANHAVDRCFVADGMRWIVDYKTAGLGESHPDVAALRTHAERYRPQLERYARLFADEGRPVRLAVFYVAYGELVEIQ